MTDLRTAAQLALEAMEGGGDSWRLVGPAIDALKAALEQPEQEPFRLQCVHCGTVYAEGVPPAVPEQEPVAMLWKVRKALALASAICDRVPNRWHHTHEIGSAEADIGDMVNAHPDGTHGYRLIQEAEAELVAYLTTPEAAPQRQPEQEPVAVCEYCEKERPVIHPPRREWRGLTDAELREAYMAVSGNEWCLGGMANAESFYEAIEAKLKELNHE